MMRKKENKRPVSPGKDAADETWLWEMQADMCQVLCNPKRLQIINLLKWGEHSVGQMEKALGVAKPNLSQHLGVMRRKGILATRREGTVIYYRLAIPNITEACEIMRQVLLDAFSHRRECFHNIDKLENRSETEPADGNRKKGKTPG